MLVVLVAAAAATTAALELRSGSGSGLAAVSKPVVHIVLEEPRSVVTVNLRTGHRTGGTSREEMWLDRQHGRERLVFTEQGMTSAGCICGHRRCLHGDTTTRGHRLRGLT
jgi:hypothetical protein